MAAGALVLVALSTGLVLRTVEARRANREAESARQVTEFVVDLFETAHPASSNRGESQLSALELLERGTAGLEQRLPEDPLIRADLMNTLGELFRALGKYERSSEFLQQATSLREANLPADHPDLLESQTDLASDLIRRGRAPEGEELLRGLLPSVEGKKRSDVLYLLANALGSQDNPAGAAETLEESIRLLSVANQADSLSAANAWDVLAHYQAQLGERESSLAAARRSLEIRQSHLGTEHALVAASYTRLAIVHQSRSEFEEAIEAAKTSVRISELVLGEDNPELIPSLNAAGWSLYHWGGYAEADKMFARGLSLAEAAPGVHPGNLALLVSGAGAVAFAEGRWSDCLGWFQRELELQQQQQDGSSLGEALALNNLAVCRNGSGEHALAQEEFDLSIEIYERLQGDDDDNLSVATPLGGLAESLLDAGEPELALAPAERAMRIVERAYGSGHPETALYHYALGRAYHGLGELVAAEEALRKSVELREAALSPNSRDLRKSREALRDFLLDVGREAEAAEIDSDLERARGEGPS